MEKYGSVPSGTKIVAESSSVIEEGTIMYVTGLLCQAFIQVSDKVALRQAVMKALKVLTTNEPPIPEDKLLAVLKDRADKATLYK